jgi:hypothetical protein
MRSVPRPARSDVWTASDCPTQIIGDSTMLNSCTIRCRAILLCLLLAVSPALLADADAQEAKKSPNAKLVRAARLVDVKAGKILEARGVWIEGDRIKEVGPIADVRKHAPPDVEEVDLGDVTILPGLIDCHTHLLR